jgi:hypothetical protein
MAICRVHKTSNTRLEDLMNQYGQNEGLRRFLQEQITGEIAEPAISEEIGVNIPHEKAINHFKGLLRMKNNRLTNLNIELTTATKRNNTEEVNRLKSIRRKLYKEIAELEDNIANLQDKQTLDVLIDVANQQLDWVKTLFSKDQVTPSEIHEASKIIELWSNIKEIVYGEDKVVDEYVLGQMNTLKARIDSEDIFGNWFRLSSDYLSQQIGYKDRTKFLQEMYGIEDLNTFTGDWRFLGATGVKFLTHMDRMLRDAVTRRDMEVSKWEKKLKEVLEPIIKKGKDNLFWQVDEKGNRTGELVNRYSQSWYNANRKSKESLQGVLSSTLNKKVRGNAYKARRKFLNDNTISVDIRYFVDPNFATAQGITKEMYTETLEKELGRDRATEVIAQALEQYAAYQEELESHTIAINDEEISQEEKDAKLAEWVSKNSPIVWLNQQDPIVKGETRTFTQFGDNRYVITKPKRFNKDGTKTEWYDSKYEQIENDPELFEAYNTVREFMTEMMSYLPKHITGRLQANFLPRVKQEMMASLTSEYMKGAVIGYADDAINSITSPANLENRYLEESELGKTFKTIPTKYTASLPIDERSTDLLKILPEFGKMALNYKWKSQIQDSVELSNKFLDVISKSKQRKELTDNELRNMKDSVGWFMDSQLYNNTRLDEGVSTFKVFKGFTFEVKNKEKAAEINARYNELLKDNDQNTAVNKLKNEYDKDIEVITSKEKYKRLERERDIIEDEFYNGKITEAQYNARIKPLEDEANSMGRNLVWSKVADKVMRYNQAMAFWFNPFSAFNNYMFGVMSNLVWSAGKVDFTPAQTMKAFGLMWKSALNLKDGRLDKVTNLIAKYNLLYENLEFGSSDTENQTLKKLKAMPYILLRKGDLFIKGQTLISLMLNKQVEVTENGVKKTIPLWEAYDNQGNWNTAKYGENTEWEGDFADVSQGQEFVKFKNYVNKVEIALHGNFDPNSVPAAKKYVLKRMLGQFRASWLIEGFAQRFQTRREDEDLGRDIEGRYRTIGRLGVKKSTQVFGKIVAGHFSGKVDLNNIPAKDRKLVEENMRKNLMEMYLYAMMFSLYLMLKAGLDDDEDDENTKLTMNMINRILQDTTFYLSPSTFIEIVRDPIPILSVPIRFGRGIDSAIDLTLDDNLTESEEAQKWRNITSNFYVINQYGKLVNMQNKIF